MAQQSAKTPARRDSYKRRFATAFAIGFLAYISLHWLLRSFVQGLGLYGIAKAVAALVVLSNAKALPFVWHLRIFSCFARSRHHRNRPYRSAQRSLLFSPHDSFSHSPLLEIDYNMHKSNSTYFSDLDVSRADLLLSLFGPGLAALRANLSHEKEFNGNRRSDEGPKPKVAIALGGASCIFRRAIPPFRRYRMSSRVLSWDRKWLYIVTHFLEAEEAGGSSHKSSSNSVNHLVDASAASVCPPPSSSGAIGESGANTNNNTNSIHSGKNKAGPNSVPYATALARYVVKAGRITVEPERLISAAGLLGDEADGSRIELERTRQQGLKYVQGFAAMDDLSAGFCPDGCQ